MKHQSICQRIDDYLDGRLNPQDQIEFEAHWESCEQCREEVRIDSGLDEMLQDAWGTIVAPRIPATQAENDSTLAPQPHRSKWFANTFPIGGLTVVTAVLVILFLIWWPSRKGEITKRLPPQPTPSESLMTNESSPANVETVRASSESAILETVRTGQAGFTLIHVFPTKRIGSKP